MHLLEYRLHELDCPDGAATALLDDLTAAYPELRPLFDRLRGRRYIKPSSFNASFNALRAKLDILYDEFDATRNEISHQKSILAKLGKPE